MRKILAIAVLVLVMLAGCKREAPQEVTELPIIGEEPNVSETPPTEVPEGQPEQTNETSAEEPTPPETVENETAVLGNETEEAAEEPEEQPEGVPITIVSQKTVWTDPNDPDNYTKTEEDSFFLDVQCAIGTSAEESGYVSNTQSDDLITFTVTNKDMHDYYLPIEKPEDSPTSEGMKLMINGRRIRNANEKCGSNYIKGNERLTCKDVRTVLKSGTSVRGQELNNKLEANTRYYKTELIFTC